MPVTLQIAPPQSLERTKVLDESGILIVNWMKWFIAVWTLLRYLSVGTGDPNNAVSRPNGSLFLRTDGGAGTTLYVKEASPTPSTGWVGK